ncbi:MAG: PAS domain S-box protein, partial [Okeania sp. SIO3H1]|nr:PAS domain S-box protein [Okeania sp. SIO3H1]
MTLSEFLASFAELTGDAITVGLRKSDEEEARIVWVNKAFSELFGYAYEEVEGQFVDITNDPDDRENFLNQVNPQIAAGHSQLHAETRCVRKDGSRFYASISMFVRPAAEGRYFVAIFRDMTALKTREAWAEAALKERDIALDSSRTTHDRLLTGWAVCG